MSYLKIHECYPAFLFSLVFKLNAVCDLPLNKSAIVTKGRDPIAVSEMNGKKPLEFTRGNRM